MLVGIQAIVAHANLGIRFGILEYLIVLPRYLGILAQHVAPFRGERTYQEHVR